MQRPVRYAVVGLGYFAQAAVLPAFKHAKRNSKLVALVSDDPAKLKQLGRRYKVPLLVSYDEYETCLASGKVDAVYIALPNSMHREYAERAARLGVHVLCEKPLAVTEADCHAMIRSAEQGNVKLMVAYRLHFEKGNLEAVKIARSGKLGELKFFNSVFSMRVREGNIRLKRKLGGGTLYDIGVYCINAARYLFRHEPHEVLAMTANTGEARFREVDEMTSAVLRFPGDRLASFTTCFGSADTSAYEIVGTKGSVRMEPAYELAEGLSQVVRIGDTTRRRHFAKRDQVAPELIYFSDCILHDREPEPSGKEGLADVRIIEALYHSAKAKRPVLLEPIDKRRRPGPEQEITRPGVRKPKLIHASSPH
jgi:glucose-fructose oxidoreductase